MKQPAGTRTYKGRRSTKSGQESFEKNEKILKKAGEFYKIGKDEEGKVKMGVKAKKKEAAPADLEEDKGNKQ